MLLYRTLQQPIISLKIGKMECCAILDTGDEAILICTDVVAKNKWIPETESQERLEFVGITGKEMPSKDLLCCYFSLVKTPEVSHISLL